MLDKIQNNNTESVLHNQSLEKIKNQGVTNPFEKDSGFFVDESLISNEAFAKYQRELDIESFKDVFNSIDEKEASKLVFKQVFEGNLSIDDEEFLADLLSSEDFLNDVI